MIVVKNRGNRINIVHRAKTYKLNTGGRRGLPGVGVPTGGADGQVLAKASTTDYDTEWVDQSGGGGAVDSVNGQTGAVVLDKDDLGLGNVDNTSDANKPISTATQEALESNFAYYVFYDYDLEEYPVESRPSGYNMVIWVGPVEPTGLWDGLDLWYLRELAPGEAPTVPGAPTSVAGTPGDEEITLTWVAPADNGGSAITGYVITPYIASVAQTPINVGNVTTYEITGLTNGIEYTFTVAATNSVGTGSDSSASSGITPTDEDTVPSAPTGVSGVAGNTQVNLSWSAPASDGGQPVTSYIITPYIGASPQTPINTGDTDLDYLVTGLTNGTAYTFTVSAVNSVGTSSPSSPSSAITPATVPTAPSNVAGTAGDSEVDLTWDAPSSNGGAAITGYTITPYIGATPQTPVVVGNVLSHTVTGLTNDTEYTFTVFATNSVGNSSPSSPSAGITPEGDPEPEYEDIVLVQAANNNVQPASTSVDFTLGAAPTPGNVLVMVYSAVSDPDITVPSGWTLYGANTIGTNTIKIIWRDVESGDSASQSFVTDNTVKSATLMEFSGVDTTSPFEGSITNSQGTSVSGSNSRSWGPSNTPTLPKAACIAAIAGNGQITSWDNAWTGGFTRVSGSNQYYHEVAVAISNSSPTAFSTSESYTAMGLRRPWEVLAVLKPKAT